MALSCQSTNLPTYPPAEPLAEPPLVWPASRSNIVLLLCIDLLSYMQHCCLLFSVVNFSSHMHKCSLLFAGAASTSCELWLDNSFGSRRKHSCSNASFVFPVLFYICQGFFGWYAVTLLINVSDVLGSGCWWTFPGRQQGILCGWGVPSHGPSV